MENTEHIYITKDKIKYTSSTYNDFHDRYDNHCVCSNCDCVNKCDSDHHASDNECDNNTQTKNDYDNDHDINVIHDTVRSNDKHTTNQLYDDDVNDIVYSNNSDINLNNDDSANVDANCHYDDMNNSPTKYTDDCRNNNIVSFYLLWKQVKV